MAKLRELESGIETELGSVHVVGRSHVCDQRIAEAAVSSLHAELTWDGETWSVQDLASRNGTFVDDRRLESGEQARLLEGATLTFGQSTPRYQVVSVEPPRLVARGPDGAVLIAEAGLLCIPHPEAAELTIYCDVNGAWFVESDEQTRRLEDRETVVASGRPWRINLPAVIEKTQELSRERELELTQLTFDFELSRDGEHVALCIVHASASIEVKFRSHLLLLSTLARQRLADMQQAHLSVGEHGWMYRSELLRELDIDARLLNLWIYRARQQLAKLGVLGAGQLIERRAGSQQLRIGVERLQMRST